MSEFTHDPSEYIRGIQQILISDKKRIGFLFGAGTSQSKKNDKSLTVPAMEKMTKNLVEEIKDNKFKDALDGIKKELGESNFNIETILSNLEQKFQIISDGNLNGLDKAEFENLIEKTKQTIRKNVNVHELVSVDNLKELVQTDFSEWIGQAERKNPIEIFTTNYDYLFELGLEHNNIPYYDGFTGSFNPFFDSESIEDFAFLPNQTKLWKIHGSLGWHFDKSSGKIIRRYSDGNDILIYPSLLKYRDSKKQPYVSLMDRLTNFLELDDSVLIACGYSFGDEHINERLISALKTNTTSHLIGFVYDKYWDEKQKKHSCSLEENSPISQIALSNNKISLYGFRTAIIGCKFGKWKLRTEPDKNDTPKINLYFDEDAPISESDELKKEKKGQEKWTGEGEFILPNFLKLVIFLKSMIVENEIRELGKHAKK